MKELAEKMFLAIFILSIIFLVGFSLIRTATYEDSKYVKCERLETIYDGTCDDFKKEISIKHYENKLELLQNEDK